MLPVTIHGDGVILDQPTFEDSDAIAAACQDPAIARWTTTPTPYSHDDAMWFLRECVQPAWSAPSFEEAAELTFAIRTASSNRLLGVVGLRPEPISSAEIGYWLAPDARGRGLMGRAVSALLDFAFAADGLALDRVGWNAGVGNVASRMVAEGCGFTVEGTVRGLIVLRGQRHDGWIGTVLAGEARPRRGSATIVTSESR